MNEYFYERDCDNCNFEKLNTKMDWENAKFLKKYIFRIIPGIQYIGNRKCYEEVHILVIYLNYMITDY